MSEWRRVADSDGPEEGCVSAVRVGDKVLALVRSGGRLWAMDAVCPHSGGPLAEGTVEDGCLVCPWHGRQFDLASGECEGFTGVTTYPVESRPDGIFIAA